MVKKKPIVLIRVSYGKKSIAAKDREYKPIGEPHSASGTKQEWRKWSKEHKLKVVFKE